MSEVAIIRAKDGKSLRPIIETAKAFDYECRISQIEDKKFEKKKICEGTCSACPYFTDLVDRPEQWGRCSKYGNAAVNRNHCFCSAYQEELKYKKVEV